MLDLHCHFHFCSPGPSCHLLCHLVDLLAQSSVRFGSVPSFTTGRVLLECWFSTWQAALGYTPNLFVMVGWILLDRKQRLRRQLQTPLTLNTYMLYDVSPESASRVTCVSPACLMSHLCHIALGRVADLKGVSQHARGKFEKTAACDWTACRPHHRDNKPHSGRYIQYTGVFSTTHRLQDPAWIRSPSGYHRRRAGDLER